MHERFRRGPVLVLLAISPLLGRPSAALTVVPGDLIILDESQGLVHVSGQTWLETAIPTQGAGFNQDAGVIVDPSTSQLIMLQGNDLVRINPTTGQSSILASGGYVDDDVAGKISRGNGGEIFYTSAHRLVFGGYEGSVVQIDPQTGDQTALFTGGLLGAEIGTVAYDSNGDYFVESASSVVRIDAATGNQSVYLPSTTGVSFGPLGVLPDNRLAVAREDLFGSFLDGNTVHRSNPNTGEYVLLLTQDWDDFGTGPLIDWMTDVVASDDGYIYYSGCTGSGGCSSGPIGRIDPATDDHEFIYSGSPVAFDVVPVPEPSARTLLLFGVMALELMRRYRARQTQTGTSLKR